MPTKYTVKACNHVVNQSTTNIPSERDHVLDISSLQLFLAFCNFHIFLSDGHIYKAMFIIIPLSPGNPFSPSSPGNPLVPGSPDAPLSPFSGSADGRPGGPLSPLSPGIPGRPEGPGSPPSPLGPGRPKPGSPLRPGLPGKPGPPGRPSMPGRPTLPWTDKLDIETKSYIIMQFTSSSSTGNRLTKQSVTGENLHCCLLLNSMWGVRNCSHIAIE